VIFLTVGSMFPFDRLVQSVDEMVGKSELSDEVFAQIGEGRFEPRYMKFCRFLDNIEFEEKVGTADYLLGHAGIGTITLALSRQIPALVVPRLSRFGEHVNDHQFATARKFEELGHVLVAYDVRDIPSKLNELRSFKASKREVKTHDLVARINRFLRDLQRA
jgi:beta-1,4-N-acetylglucosaminyltransferase